MPVGITAGLSAAAGLAGAAIQSKAAGKAAAASTAATNAATDLQRNVWNDTKGLYTDAINRNEPVRQYGLSALDQIAGQYGLPVQTRAAATPGADPGSFDWEAYLRANPDLETEAQRVVGNDPRFPTRAAYAAWQWQNYGQNEQSQGRVPPPSLQQAKTTPADAGQGSAGAATPTQPNAYAGEVAPISRQTDPTAPTFTRPDIGARPQMAPLDLSANAYQVSPGYQWQRQQGLDAIASSKALGSLLKSGSALKSSLEYSQGLADQDYNAWADRATSRYYTDQARGDNNYALDRSRSDSNFAADRDFGNTNYYRNLARNDAIFTEDRGYNTGRYDTRTNNLFNIANLGQNATNSTNGLIGSLTGANQSFANNIGSLGVANANTQGQAAVGAANAWAQGLGTAAGAASGVLGNYFGRSDSVIRSSNPYGTQLPPYIVPYQGVQSPSSALLPVNGLRL